MISIPHAALGEAPALGRAGSFAGSSAWAAMPAQGTARLPNVGDPGGGPVLSQLLLKEASAATLLTGQTV